MPAPSEYGSLEPGTDGFFHPSCEDDLIALIRRANTERRKLRVRGSCHSVARAIYSNSVDEFENKVHRQIPPPGPHMDVMLDRYRGIVSADPKDGLVVVRAGTHLGADPADPAGAGSIEESLLYTLFSEYGLTIPNLGGTTHQTVGGFLSTGSAGASTWHCFSDSIEAIRIIDGTGTPHCLHRSDPDFDAAAVSLGLLGIISTVTFRCVPTFNIVGQEYYTTADKSGINLFGDDTDGNRPTLEAWLKTNEYSRIEWWPQPGAERFEIWHATRIDATDDFQPRPYRQFGPLPVAEQFGAALFLTAIGNVDDPERGIACMQPASTSARAAALQTILKTGVPEAVGKLLARAVESAARAIAFMAIYGMALNRHLVMENLPRLIRMAVSTFIPEGKQKQFWDYSWRAIPIDAETDDLIFPVGFSETWVPLAYATRVMSLLRTHFNGVPGSVQPIDDHEKLERTGTMCWEIYATSACSHWLSPAYSDGNDQWAGGAFRIDPYWFAHNPGAPTVAFFPRYWSVLRAAKIPFRFHWGKHQPAFVDKADRDQWAYAYEDQYPRWKAFLEVRAKMDPGGIFLTEYWKERLNL